MVTEFRKTFRAIATRSIIGAAGHWKTKFRKTFRTIGVTVDSKTLQHGVSWLDDGTDRKGWLSTQIARSGPDKE